MLHFALLLSKEISSDIIGITHLHTKFNIFGQKTVVPIISHSFGALQKGQLFYSILRFADRRGRRSLQFWGCSADELAVLNEG